MNQNDDADDGKQTEKDMQTDQLRFYSCCMLKEKKIDEKDLTRLYVTLADKFTKC